MEKKLLIFTLSTFSFGVFAAQSPYKTNDLRLGLDSIGSSIVDSNSSTVSSSYLGLGGEYQYEKPTAKYVSGLLASGSYNVNNDSKSVGVAKLKADLAKKNGKERFDLSLNGGYRKDYTDLSYSSLNDQFYADFERRQLAQIANVSSQDSNPVDLELKNSENLSFRFNFDNSYQRNNHSKIDVGTTLALYNIYGYYQDSLKSTIERDLVQGRGAYVDKIYRLWDFGLNFDYGVLREKDTNSIESKAVYEIETRSQNALLYFKRKESPDRYLSIFLDYKGLRYSDNPDTDVFIPGVEWSFKANSRTAFKLGLSEGFILDDGVFSATFYPSFELTYQSSSKSYLSINLRNDIENMMDYFFSSEMISSPLQESLTQRSLVRLDWIYKLRRSSLEVSGESSRRIFIDSNQFEYSNRYSLDYKYIVSRKIDVLAGFSGYTRTREVDDSLLDYNANGYFANLSFIYLTRSNRRIRGSSGITLDYTYGLNSDTQDDIVERQNIFSLKFDLKV